MCTPAEVTLTLKEAIDAFATVAGKPNDNKTSAISDVLISTLMMVVKYNGTNNVQKIYGVIATDKDYAATTGQTVPFDIPNVLNVYDKATPPDATIATVWQLEVVRPTSSTTAICTTRPTQVSARLFSVPSTKSGIDNCASGTIYSQVSAKALLVYMRAVCTGLHDIVTVPMFLSMLTVQIG